MTDAPRAGARRIFMVGKVIAGEFENQAIVIKGGKVVISKGFGGRVIDFTTITGYEVVTDDVRKSAASGVARGLVGGLLLGGVGMVAGAMSAKNTGSYQVAVEFVDGKKSLLQVSAKVYKQIVKDCFDSGRAKLTAEGLAEQERGFAKKERRRTLRAFVVFLVALAFLVAVIRCGMSAPA